MGFVTSPKVTSTPRDHLSEGHQIKIKSINHEAVTQCPERARTKKGKLQRTLLCRGRKKEAVRMWAESRKQLQRLPESWCRPVMSLSKSFFRRNKGRGAENSQGHQGALNKAGGIGGEDLFEAQTRS